MGGVRGDDSTYDPERIRRAYGDDVPRINRRDALQDGHDDARFRQDSRRSQSYEADVPGTFPAAAADDDAEGDAGDAGTSKKAGPYAELYG